MWGGAAIRYYGLTSPRRCFGEGPASSYARTRCEEAWPSVAAAAAVAVGVVMATAPPPLACGN